MPRNRSGRRSSTRRPKGNLQWIQNQTSAPVTVVAGAITFAQPLAALSPDSRFIGITVLRSIFNIRVRPSIVGNIVQFVHGFVVLSDEALVVPVLPAAGTAESKWRFLDGGEVQTDTDAGPQGKLFSYDLRNRIQINAGFDLAWTLENTDAADSLNVSAFFNMLIAR